MYRQATEALTNHKLKIVEGANGDVAAVESALGGMVEQIIVDGKDEELLAGKMIDWKA